MPETDHPDLLPQVRPACPADVPVLVQMIGELARHHGDIPRASEAALAQDLFGPAPWLFAFVAKRGAVLLGYTLLCRLYRAQFGERGMDMHHLFVTEPARGTGVGSALVAAALAQARSCGCAYFVIGTHPDNAAAQRFYEGRGFERATPPGPRFRMRLREPSAVPA